MPTHFRHPEGNVTRRDAVTERADVTFAFAYFFILKKNKNPVGRVSFLFASSPEKKNSYLDKRPTVGV